MGRVEGNRNDKILAATSQCELSAPVGRSARCNVHYLLHVSGAISNRVDVCGCLLMICLAQVHIHTLTHSFAVVPIMIGNS